MAIDIPLTHIGLILDGNRRYAQSQGMPLVWGHNEGAQKLIEILEWLDKTHPTISQISVYALSIDNLKRETAQVQDLFRLFDDYFRKILPKIETINCHILFCGDLTLFSNELRQKMTVLDTKTKHLPKQLHICFGYSGQDELIRAVLALQSKQTPITIDSVTSALDISHSPQVIIRTGGRCRTSNFLVWQSVYSEWFFLEKFWPQITPADIDAVLVEYANIVRNFGV
jgi:undecaprenyl diphosphate synthase